MSRAACQFDAGSPKYCMQWPLERRMAKDRDPFTPKRPSAKQPVASIADKTYSGQPIGIPNKCATNYPDCSCFITEGSYQTKKSQRQSLAKFQIRSGSLSTRLSREKMTHTPAQRPYMQNETTMLDLTKFRSNASWVVLFGWT